MQKLNSLLMANPYWQHCQSWYGMRPPGDRKILQLLFTVVLTGLIYLLILEPVSQWSETQKSAYLYQQEMNAWLHGNLPRARNLQKNQQAASSRQELSSIATNVAQQADISLGRVQPDRKGLSVWIEDAAYQKLLKWLVLLQTKHGVALQQVRIEQLKEEGRVKSYIHLGG
ncbi:type II secretion system protein M [Endozoicomonas sp. SESOKO1]|uniref:type II secretion system protein M n=1 Tax=Endozoicomonas sp. SESOKO1 TaxID=2828742 RepID=UPI0021491ABA|nr:type II secretion system protein M [Endozoicomonas sp. SESOKO1]